jgi:hypothetical protein
MDLPRPLNGLNLCNGLLKSAGNPAEFHYHHKIYSRTLPFVKAIQHLRHLQAMLHLILKK